MNHETSTTTTPMKTLWFEFLLSPHLLEKHLNDENADPSPTELIIHFLTNASNACLSNSVDEHLNNGQQQQQQIQPTPPPSPPLPPVQQQQQFPPKAEAKNEDAGNKKSLALKLLALKVGAHLKWNLDEFEASLPLTIQYLLFNELIKLCEKSEEKNCNLFSYILYYRWILRSLIKVSYPVRGQKGLPMPIPLLQHIDPTYVPHETMENLVKKLHELANSAVLGLEKVVQESESKQMSSAINMPLAACFSTLNENSDDMKCDWSQVEVLNAKHVVDILRYELGKWFFFNENYQKAKNYLENVDLKYQSDFESFNEYLQAANEMLGEVLDYDYEMQDSQNYFSQCIEKILVGESCDILAIERKVEPSVILQELNDFYRGCNDTAKKDCIRKFAIYLSSRLNGIKEFLKDFIDNEKMDTSEMQDNNVSQTAVEEGEIDVVEEEVDRDPELQLLEATDPELIQNLATKVSNLPLAINKKWDIPRTHSMCLVNLPKPQYCKCHIVLAKAAELRKAKLYIESRTLYLSLLEDIQASLPSLANIITLELLQTDLEYHFDTNDIDERRNLDLMQKSERALRNESAVSQVLPDIIDLCCIFLLESGAPLLKDFINYNNNPIVKFSASLFCIAEEGSSVTNNFRVKEVWDFVISAISVVSKRTTNYPGSALSFTTLYNFLRKLKSLTYISIMLSCLIKIRNLILDNPSLELSCLSFPCIQWPQSLGINSSSIVVSNLTILIQTLLDKGLPQKPNEISLIRCKAELNLIEGNFVEALKQYLTMLIIVTEYFTSFGNYCDEETIYQRMIKCCTSINCFTQAAVLHQMTRDPNYSYIFMALNEKNCHDSCDDLYHCFWDITILEYLVNLHTRRGELDKKHKAIQMIGQLELNANNGEDISKEAANVRRGKFFRIMAKKYM
ncbi:integrator complex subunit 8-like protein [Dinothrombium tinctorium]|uniref:Integrator complex subunit 8-like protein n=1 Tax=Dinothrombium tinctorium TaxID=1965070 RepID=A0A443R7G1_9ACAR|nr:integrator complex subunit 8-like protein [Dinothrombium tinctorium]